MGNRIIATDDQMMAEAAVRMKSIGFPQEYIDNFLDKSIVEVFMDGKIDRMSDEEIDKRVYESVEDYNGGYPWAMIKEDLGPCIWREGGWGVDVVYYVLFVSTDMEEWEKERQELAALEPTMMHYRFCSQLYPDETDIKLVKKMIRINENGAIELA